MVKKHIYYRKDIKLVVSLGFQREKFLPCCMKFELQTSKILYQRYPGALEAGREGGQYFIGGGGGIYFGVPNN
jgi:hypothetical protein